MNVKEVSWRRFGLHSPLGKALMIGALILILQIPIMEINGLIGERSVRYHNVVTEITEKWGGEQTVNGPFLVVPVDTMSRSADLENPSKQVVRTHYLMMTPTFLHAKFKVVSDSRYRGIYEAPLYHTDADLKGAFDLRPQMAELTENQALRLKDAYLSVAIGDVKAIQSPIKFLWNEHEAAPSPGGAMADVDGVHVRLPVGSISTEAPNDFNLAIRLKGAQALYVSPVGQESNIEINGDWNDPSFQGDWLPVERKLEQDAFYAKWDIPFLAKGAPASWTGSAPALLNHVSPLVGVSRPAAGAGYQEISRSVKYALLFLTCTFACLWLFEIISGVRIHVMQYLFTGLTLCLFYLLFLSLSEHVGTWAAYLIACGAVIGQVGWYAGQFIRRRKLTIAFITLLIVLYGYLLSLLNEQDMALLYGSLGLFIILGAAMFATRKIDWYNLRGGDGEVAEG
ncbi:Inner membrane protein involved in colicin E2 resistance [Hahella chejuensis KCTC 2396]|uniref:Inner membrane protein involved in colicin E2 resistance n=1 Tax=Hahella chejuensis (strain KCTC 2396) TaxID=349521 RepID=Q2SNB5_HAHCH|nr:cell envelope integrity protein CreD [Hahella chejuensis]ABC27859.1 Inner membrane protein involved in colicin E2 resistance [Hahella chejuensis KCTC 2396]